MSRTSVNGPPSFPLEHSLPSKPKTGSSSFNSDGTLARGFPAQSHVQVSHLTRWQSHAPEDQTVTISHARLQAPGGQGCVSSAGPRPSTHCPDAQAAENMLGGPMKGTEDGGDFISLLGLGRRLDRGGQGQGQVAQSIPVPVGMRFGEAVWGPCQPTQAILPDQTPCQRGWWGGGQDCTAVQTG